MVTYFQTEAQVLIKQLAQDDLEYVEKQKQEEKAKANKKKKKQLKKEQAKQNRANRTLKDSQKDATIKEKGTDQAQAGHGLEDAGSSSDSDSSSDSSSSSSSTDSDSDDETELEKDADAEDGFLEQWCETLHNTINKPMYEAFKIKEDDAAEEEKVRAMVRGIIFVGEAFITALKTRRRRNALKKFMLSKQKLLVDVDNEKIRDENNRDRNKLELFTNGRNQEYAYFISDKDLQVGLDKYGRRYDTVTSLKDVRLTPSEWQIECWNDWDTQERWLRYRVQWLPEEWWADVILPVYIQFAVQARLVDINIEHELGSIKTQRFYKLINFINTEMCGQWHQRVLIVLAWIIGAVKTVVDTTEWHYRSSLLIQTIEQTLTARRGGSGRGGGRGGTSLMDVCVSIVVMKSSSALLADLLDKVKEAGKGGNCCVLWKGGGVEGWNCGSPVQTVSLCTVPAECKVVCSRICTPDTPLLFIYFVFRPRKHPKVVGAQSHPPHFEPRFGRRREQRRRQRQIPSIDLLLVVQSKLGPQPRVGVVDSSRFNLSNHHDRLFRDIDVEQVSVVAGDGGGGDLCERKD
jgi:hypothetical protein